MGRTNKTRKAKLQTEAREAELEEKRQRTIFRFIAEDPTPENVTLYWRNFSKEERNKLKAQSKDFTVAAILSREEDEDDIDALFSTVRVGLCSALEYCRDATHWRSGVPDIVSAIVCFCEENKEELSLTKTECGHLYAIGMLCHCMGDYELAFEVVDRVQQWCGGRNAVDFLVEEVLLPNPGRGHLLHKLTEIVLCGKTHCTDSKMLEKLYSWVEEEDVLRVCEAIKLVLLDLRSTEETNGWCYLAAMDILQCQQWVEEACPILLEAAREAWVRNQVDETNCGDFSDLLMCVSLSKACQQNARNLSNSSKGAEYDDSEPSAEEYEEKWAFFMREWERNPQGIPTCRCFIPKPIARCHADFARNLRQKIRVTLNCANEVFKRSEYRQVIKMANDTLEFLCKLQQARSIDVDFLVSTKFHEKCSDAAHLLRGDSFFALECFEDAYVSYAKVCQDLLRERKQSFKTRIKANQAEALYGCAVSLEAIGKVADALAKLKILTNYARNVDEDKKDSKVMEWCHKARALLHSHEVENSPAQLVNLQHAENAGVIVSSKKPLCATDSTIEVCNWKEVGSIENDDGSLNTTVELVDRLKWALIWVRRELLVWNYGVDEVVCWLSLASLSNEGEFYDILCTPHLVETPAGLLFIASTHCGKVFCFAIDKLETSTQGEHLNFLTETVRFKASHLCTAYWEYIATAVLRQAACISSHQQPDGNWKLAVSYWQGSLKVSVYGEEHIIPDGALGPLSFNSCSGTQKQLIGHDRIVYALVFFGDESLRLITSGSDPCIKIWDLESETCLASIRAYDTTVSNGKICVSKTLLFVSPSKTPTSYFIPETVENELNYESPSCIGVWSAGDGSRLGTLCTPLHGSKDEPTVTELSINPNTSQLVSAHSNGVVNIWRYSEFLCGEAVVLIHMYGFHMFENIHDGINVTIKNQPASVLYVASTKSVFALSLDGKAHCSNSKFPAEPTDPNNITLLRPTPRIRNCNHCGLFKFSKPSMKCRQCSLAFFCDKECLKGGWKKHKAFCLQVASASKVASQKKKLNPV